MKELKKNIRAQEPIEKRNDKMLLNLSAKEIDYTIASALDEFKKQYKELVDKHGEPKTKTKKTLTELPSKE